MRRASMMIGVCVAVLIVVSLIVWATFDVNRYRSPIQAELQRRLGRAVSLGQMHVALFPPSFRVENLKVSDNPEFGRDRPFVQAERVNVSAKLLPLLRGRVEIDSLDLHRPVVELVRSKQGGWNYASLGAGGSHRSSLSLGAVSIEDGQVAVTDEKTGESRVVYDRIDVTLDNLRPDSKFSVQMTAGLPGKGDEEVRIDGEGGPIRQGNLAATPFQGTVQMNGVGLAGLQRLLRKPGWAAMDGTVTGNIKLDLQPEMASAAGDLKIQSARVRGVAVGYPITVRFNANEDPVKDLVTISKAAIMLGSTPLSVSGTLNTKASPTRLDLHLKADNSSLVELARLASAFGVGFSPNTTVNGLVNSNVQIRGTTGHPTLNGTLVARNVRVSGKQLRQPLDINAVKFNLTPADIRSDEFDIVSGGTTLRSRFVLREYASESPVVSADLRAPAAEFGAVLALVKAYGVRALDNLNGNGTLSLNMQLSGRVKSLTGDGILRALDGNSRIQFSNLRFGGTNLSRDISSVAGFLKPVGSSQGFTDISTVRGDIIVRNGVAGTTNVEALLDLGTIGVMGTADLARQLLDLHVNAVMTQKVSEEVGGTNIGGYMTRALANDKGELVIPVRITGTFQHPKVTPDLEMFALMKLKTALPNTSDPTAGISDVLGRVLGQKTKPQPPESKPPDEQTPGDQQQQQNPAQKTVEEILQALSGKKKNDKEKQPDSKPTE